MTSGTPKRLFLAAGEVSGDARAAELIAELRPLVGDLTVHAIAGARVAAQGATVVRDLDALHSVRVKELRERREHWAQLRADLPELLRAADPDLIVLVQNPQLNRLVARAAKQVLPEVPVVWYMPPEIWAWDFPAWLGRLSPSFEPRALVVRDTCTAVITVHAFEREVYLPYLPAEHIHQVDHPAMAYVTAAVPNPSGSRMALHAALRLPPDTRVLGLFPGSRRDEIETLFPLMIEVARRLGDPDLAFVSVAATPDLEANMRAADPDGLCRIVTERPFLDVLASCDLALLASGTTTLDAAVLGVPHVVLYRLDPITYLMARAFGRVDWYGLPNIIAGREICPERRNFRATPARVHRTVRALLDDPTAFRSMSRGLAEVRQALGGPTGISDAAAILTRYLP